MAELLRRPSLPEQESLDTRAKVDLFVLSDVNYFALPPALREIAISKAVTFIDLPEQKVHDRAKHVYDANSPFVRQQKKGFESVYDIYDVVLDLRQEEIDSKIQGKIAKKEEVDKVEEVDKAAVVEAAEKNWRKSFRAVIATLEARAAFADVLHYTPGIHDYKTFIANEDFLTADSLVRKAIKKFA